MGLFYVSWKLHSCLYIPRRYLLSCNTMTLLSNGLLVCWNNSCTLFYKAAPVPQPLLVCFIMLAFEPKCTAVNFCLIIFFSFFFSIMFPILQDNSTLTHSLPYPQQPTLRVWFPKQFFRSTQHYPPVDHISWAFLCHKRQCHVKAWLRSAEDCIFPSVKSKPLGLILKRCALPLMTLK